MTSSRRGVFVGGCRRLKRRFACRMPLGGRMRGAGDAAHDRAACLPALYSLQNRSSASYDSRSKRGGADCDGVADLGGVGVWRRSRSPALAMTDSIDGMGAMLRRSSLVHFVRWTASDAKQGRLRLVCSQTGAGRGPVLRTHCLGPILPMVCLLKGSPLVSQRTQ